MTTQSHHTSTALQPYGRMLSINGKQLNVYQAGTGSDLVLLPGFGDLSQYYSHYYLIQSLAEHYRVTVIEPFGRGWSEVTDSPRNLTNLNHEIHQALTQLDVTHYVMVAHSISGLYALDYVARFQGEVRGIIGIDSSTPLVRHRTKQTYSQLLTAKQAGKSPLPPLDYKQFGYSDALIQQYRLIADRQKYNANLLDEAKHLSDNISQAACLRFPAGLPVLHLLAEDSVLNFSQIFGEKHTKGKSWVKEHLALSENPADVRIKIIPGFHALALCSHHAMLPEIIAFMSEIASTN